jgi:hypothetical protein
MTVEVIGVAVREQAQAGGRTDLEQGKRLGQRRQQRQEGRASGRLVRLRSPCEEDREDLVATLEESAAELRPPLGHPAHVPDGGEQQIGLLLARRQLG